MIAGRIDEFGRALITLSLRPASDMSTQELDVWVDTGFTGELVLSESLAIKFGLSQSAMVAAELADGSKSFLSTYSCLINWFGESRETEVVASQGQVPLLGVGLLLGHRLVVDYQRLTLSIE